MSELVPEVCREHHAADCGTCDEHDDGLWVHPQDLEPAEPSKEDARAEIIAQHADYVSGGARHCTCGLWSDESPDAQSTRMPFAHHVMARLALHGYAVTAWGISTLDNDLQRELERLRRFSAVVENFISDRGQYITAIECSPGDNADYHRWQGHAESRRQLLASLPWSPDDDTAERVKSAARVT